MQRPIVPPSDLCGDIEVMYVALNPQYSKKIIQDIEYFAGKNISYFYI
jgi:hypothetical protein